MIKWSVEHKSIILLLVVLILMAGGFLYGAMERQENPTVAAPIALIKTIYPGATPEDVEKLIIKPIEDEIKKISEIKTLESFAVDSLGIVKITLKDISDEKIDEAWDDVKDGIDMVKPQLPTEAQEPIMDTELANPYGIIVGLTSMDYTYQDLSDVANKLRDELRQDPGVKAVDIEGKVNDEINIYLDMIKLKEYGVSPTTISTAIKARNINIPGGNLVLDQVKVPVQVSGEYVDVEQIKNTIVAVSKESGAPIYLKDVAKVERTQEKKEIFASVNNKKALLIGVEYMDGENIVAIGERLDIVIEEFKDDDLYENMELFKITDQADFTKDAINVFERNLISAIVLIVVVVIATMGIRSALVVSLPIPIVIVMVFIFMYLTDTPLHQVSIASLIISLSLLVANGIVANDNINVYLEKGHDKLTACTFGVEEVKIPILTSTLTTIASFLPLAMMQGVAGKFAKSLPILVSVALICSYITALTVIPAVGYKLMELKENNPGKKIIPGAKKIKVGGFFKKTLDIYEKLLAKALNIPAIVIMSFIGILMISLLIIPSLGVQLFPPVDRDQFVIDITVQDGSDVEKTERAAMRIGELLKKDSAVEDFAYMVGDGMLQYYITFTPNDPANNKAQFLVNGKRNEIERMEEMLMEEVPGVSINMRQLEIAVPVKYPVQVRVSGDEIAKLRGFAEEIKDILYDIPGIKTIEDNYGYDSYRMNIEVNEEKANMVGITNYDIASTVRMAINGLEVSELKEEDIEKDAIPIKMKIADEEKEDRDILNNIFITSQITEKNIPIDHIAHIDTNVSLNKIVRRNGERTITVGMFVEGGYTSNEVLKTVKERMVNYELPDGYTMEFGGESEKRNDAFESMVNPAIFAVVLIYFILVLQFGNLKGPLIILGTIPLSFIGIIWGLKLMGYPIGFMALLGAISLMGVVVNNGIVLLDYIKLLRKEKDEVKEAIIEASKTRMRPIMIGMVTTVISLIPLGLFGGPLWAPMAAAIIFGMLVSSVLTLLVIPCMYLVIEGRKSINLSTNI